MIGIFALCQANESTKGAKSSGMARCIHFYSERDRSVEEMDGLMSEEGGIERGACPDFRGGPEAANCLRCLKHGPDAQCDGAMGTNLAN